MKKSIIFLVIMLLITLISCEDASQNEGKIFENNSTDGVSIHDEEMLEADIKIALVMKTLTNPFFIEMERGARNASKELDISLQIETGAQETSIDQQITIVEELINDKIDAIVIAPGDSRELVPVLKKAQDAGIVIVNIDNKLDDEVSNKLGLLDVPFISVDNKKAAYYSAKYISDLINQPTKVLILEGIKGAQNSELRKLGAIEAFSENDNIEIVSVISANWKIDEAQAVTESQFFINPDIGAIFAANDMMGIGAIQYLKRNNLSDVFVAAFDAIPEATEVIKEGWLDVTIDQQPYLQGYKGVQYAMKMINGEEVPLETLVDSIVVDKTNAK